MRAPSAAIVAAILGLTAAGHARQQKIAVMPFDAQGVDERVTTIMDSLLAIEVDNLGVYEVVSSSDIRAILGLEGIKQSLGCTETACAAELGGALGADLMLAGVIGRLGDSILLTAKVIDVKGVRTLKRTSVKMPNDENVFDKGIGTLVRKLFPAAGQIAGAGGGGTQSATGGNAGSGAARSTAGGNAVATRASGAATTTASGTSPPSATIQAGPGTGISNGWWLTAAAVGTAAGVLGLTSGLLARNAEDTARKGINDGIITDSGASPQEAAEQSQSLARVANSLLLTAAVMAAAAIPLYLFSRPLSDAAASATLVPVPLPGGGALITTVRF